MTKKCNKCNDKNQRLLYQCPECKTLFCEPCAISLKKICPNCYSSLDFN